VWEENEIAIGLDNPDARKLSTTFPLDNVRRSVTESGDLIEIVLEIYCGNLVASDRDRLLQGCHSISPIQSLVHVHVIKHSNCQLYHLYIDNIIEYATQWNDLWTCCPL
jgi:hypothetical protein